MISEKISIIIPVKDNQSGVERFLHSFFETQFIENYPEEILIVDNDSEVPIRIPDLYKNKNLDINLFQFAKQGPACARNFGAKNAKAEWLLFIDSDCVASKTTITGYLDLGLESSVAGYQGFVGALGKDFISRYYESQEIHQAPKMRNSCGQLTPKYLVAANILINKKSFNQINGFDERYVFGGEDIDFGIRLSKIGRLQFANEAIVLHNYNDGLKGFVRRFIEYGKGNRLVEKNNEIHLIPLPFTAKKKTILINHLLSILQWACLLIGYLMMNQQIRKNS